eukprot:gene1638-1008_t
MARGCCMKGPSGSAAAAAALCLPAGELLLPSAGWADATGLSSPYAAGEGVKEECRRGRIITYGTTYTISVRVCAAPRGNNNNNNNNNNEYKEKGQRESTTRNTVAVADFKGVATTKTNNNNNKNKWYHSCVSAMSWGGTKINYILFGNAATTLLQLLFAYFYKHPHNSQHNRYATEKAFRSTGTSVPVFMRAETLIRVCNPLESAKLRGLKQNTTTTTNNNNNNNKLHVDTPKCNDEVQCVRTNGGDTLHTNTHRNVGSKKKKKKSQMRRIKNLSYERENSKETPQRRKPALFFCYFLLMTPVLQSVCGGGCSSTEQLGSRVWGVRETQKRKKKGSGKSNNNNNNKTNNNNNNNNNKQGKQTHTNNTTNRINHGSPHKLTREASLTGTEEEGEHNSLLHRNTGIYIYIYNTCTSPWMLPFYLFLDLFFFVFVSPLFRLLWLPLCSCALCLFQHNTNSLSLFLSFFRPYFLISVLQMMMAMSRAPPFLNTHCDKPKETTNGDVRVYTNWNKFPSVSTKK